MDILGAIFLLIITAVVIAMPVLLVRELVSMYRSKREAAPIVPDSGA